MSVIKGTFSSRFESKESDFCKNKRLLFELNYLFKIKKNTKKCKKVLHLYVPFFTDRYLVSIILWCLSTTSTQNPVLKHGVKINIKISMDIFIRLFSKHTYIR